MRRLLLALTMIISVVAAVTAADATLTAVAPRNAVEGQRFAVVYRLDNGDGSSLEVSQVNGCQLIYGPSVSTSQSISIVNGAMQRSSRTDYTYMYVADKAGEYTIPTASVVVNGKKVTSKPVKFSVMTGTQASTPAAQRPTSAYDADTQQAGRQVNSSDVFVRINLSKASVWEQEAVECTIKLYTTYSINEFMATKQPEFEGCLIQELDIKPSLNQEETLNGRTYLTAILKKCILYPQRSGKITINSGNYDLSVVQYENVSMGGFMTVRQPVTRKIQITSNAATLNVKALPEPRPAGFSGAVGVFTATSKLVGNQLRTNDPASLIFTVKGTGNIKYLKEPEIDFPSEFELYAPQTDINAHVTGSNVTGTMTVDYTFVPQTTGEFTIGSEKFVYFDPSKGEYVTVDTPSYNIKVSKGASTTATADQEAIAAKNTDILHIRLGHDGRPARGLIVATTWYWLIYVGLVVALLAALLIWRRNIQRRSDMQGMRLARAGKKARRLLSEARKQLQAKDSDKFYEATLRALNGYLSDKFSIPVSDLSRPAIEERLQALGAPEQLSADTLDILDTCEMARYTPHASSEMDAVYDRADATISSLERLSKKAR